MDPRDKKELESMVASLLAHITKVQSDLGSLQSFCLSALENLGLRGVNGGPLLPDLEKFQDEELNRRLATLADTNPSVASELKKILDGDRS